MPADALGDGLPGLAGRPEFGREGEVGTGVRLHGRLPEEPAARGPGVRDREGREG